MNAFPIQNIPKVTGARKRKMTYNKISAVPSFIMQPSIAPLMTNNPILLKVVPFVMVPVTFQAPQQSSGLENERKDPEILEKVTAINPKEEVKKEPVDDYPNPIYSHKQLPKVSKTEVRDDSERDSLTPEAIDKRIRNKNAVQRHRKKMNEYLETAPKNIRNMEQIEKELDRSIAETESHIKTLETILVQINCNSAERSW